MTDKANDPIDQVEVQSATLGGAPTGGTFTLSANGHTTAPIAFNASAAAVETAFQSLWDDREDNAMTDNKASDLIGQAEALAGCRWDDPNGLEFAALFGAVAREMARNPHLPKDDIAIGLFLREQMAEHHQHTQESKRMMAVLLAGGLGPDDLAALMGTKIK